MELTHPQLPQNFAPNDISLSKHKLSSPGLFSTPTKRLYKRQLRVVVLHFYG